MKRTLIAFCIVALCQNLKADAVTYNEPRKDQSNILIAALTKLQAIERVGLSSNHDDTDSSSYYLRDASFLGRTKTARGFKNLIRVTFIRSSLYSQERALTPPPRGHSFVVIFDDDLTPERLIDIPLPNSASLEESVLIVEDSRYPLTTDATFEAFSPIKSEQGGAGQPATSPESKSEDGDKN